MGSCCASAIMSSASNPLNNLANASLENTVPYIVCPDLKLGKVIKVYDGDTITIAAYIDGETQRTLYRFSVRINGIDCPEMKPKHLTEQESKDPKRVEMLEYEKKLGMIARAEMCKFVADKLVKLENVKLEEKFKRILADVIAPNGVNMTQHMLALRLAVPYKGGHKGVLDWKQYHETGGIVYYDEESKKQQMKK